MKSYQTLSNPKINNLLLIGAGLIGGSVERIRGEYGVYKSLVLHPVTV